MKPSRDLVAAVVIAHLGNRMSNCNSIVDKILPRLEREHERFKERPGNISQHYILFQMLCLDLGIEEPLVQPSTELKRLALAIQHVFFATDRADNVTANEVMDESLRRG